MLTTSRPKEIRGIGPKRGRHFYTVVAAGLIALIPLLLFSVLWVRSELRRSQRDVESFLATRAAGLSQRVDAELEPSLAALKVLSLLPGLPQGAGAFGQIAGTLLKGPTHWSGLGVVSVPDGHSIFPSPRGEIRADAANIGRAIERKAPIVAVQDGGTAGPDIYFYAPVDEEAGRTALVASMSVSDLQALMSPTKNRGVLATIVDGNGRVLTRAVSADTQEEQTLDPRLATSFAGQDAGLFTAPAPDGRSVTYAFSRSPLTNWLSIVSMDRRQVEEMSARSSWSTIAAGAISLVLAVALILFIVHSVLERKVNEERLAASEALGKLDARLLATTQEALGEQRKSSLEREVLLREIYHRVKNNLQIVQSLLRLGSRDLKAEQREPFESAVRRIGAMARVHTLLYNSPDLASIDFKIYIEDLLRELSDSFGGDDRRIVHALRASSMMVPLDTAVPLAFIAVELLTNAFRHAFPDGRSGLISVEIADDEPFGTLRISDDGVGFSSDGKRRLGLTIVRKLVQQIGGSITEPASGASEFLIRFPLQAPTADGPPAVASVSPAKGGVSSSS